MGTSTLGLASHPQMPVLTAYGVTSAGSRPASPGSGQLVLEAQAPTFGASGFVATAASGLSVTPPLVAAIV